MLQALQTDLFMGKWGTCVKSVLTHTRANMDSDMLHVSSASVACRCTALAVHWVSGGMPWQPSKTSYMNCMVSTLICFATMLHAYADNQHTCVHMLHIPLHMELLIIYRTPLRQVQQCHAEKDSFAMSTVMTALMESTQSCSFGRRFVYIGLDTAKLGIL